MLLLHQLMLLLLFSVANAVVVVVNAVVNVNVNNFVFAITAPLATSCTK